MAHVHSLPCPSFQAPRMNAGKLVQQTASNMRYTLLPGRQHITRRCIKNAQRMSGLTVTRAIGFDLGQDPAKGDLDCRAVTPVLAWCATLTCSYATNATLRPSCMHGRHAGQCGPAPAHVQRAAAAEPGPEEQASPSIPQGDSVLSCLAVCCSCSGSRISDWTVSCALAVMN